MFTICVTVFCPPSICYQINIEKNWVASLSVGDMLINRDKKRWEKNRHKFAKCLLNDEIKVQNKLDSIIFKK